MFRYLVLGLLRDGQPRHGYALMKAYRARSSLNIPTGNFYRELTRLLVEGDIEPAERAPSTDRRRVPYRITAEGERRFDRWLAAPLRASDAERADDLALRVLVLPAADPELVLGILGRWKQDLWLRTKVLESERDQASQTHADDAVPRELLIRRRLGHLACDIDLITALEIHYAQLRPGSAAKADAGAPAEVPPGGVATVTGLAARRSLRRV